VAKHRSSCPSDRSRCSRSVKGSRTTVAVTRPTGTRESDTRESDRRGRHFAQTAFAQPAESVNEQPVGVRNSDHALDLRIRSGRRRRASDSKGAREASPAIRFAYLGCRTARVRSRSVQDLSPSDSDLSQLGWRRGSHSGFREGDSRRSDRRPDRAKPQVTRVIGVFDPYRIGHEEKMIFTGSAFAIVAFGQHPTRSTWRVSARMTKQDRSFDRDSGDPKEPMSMWHTRPTGSAHDEPQSLRDSLDRPRRESG
jgi:hypothetical protein